MTPERQTPERRTRERQTRERQTRERQTRERPHAELLAELEEERKFLLSSIRDIEREHAVGDVGTDDFHTLRDGYVARAATVLREIDDGRRALQPSPARSRWRTVTLVGVTLAVAVGLGVFVAQSAGQRLPGQGLTGGERADEVAVRLVEARQALGADNTASLAAYTRVLELEPDNVEARTYTAWLVVQNGSQSQSQEQVRQGLDLLRDAIEIDPTYADPHCFVAITSANFLDPPDLDAVVSEGNACLERNPPAAMWPSIEQMVADATAQQSVTPTT